MNWVEEEMRENALKALGQGNQGSTHRLSQEEFEEEMMERLRPSIDALIEINRRGPALYRDRLSRSGMSQRYIDRISGHQCGSDVGDFFDDSYIIN